MTLGLDTAPAAAPAKLERARGGLSEGFKTAIAMVCLLVVMARVTIHAGQPLDNGDTWFHLRIGHELWGSWSLGHPGQLSSHATSAWVPTQWSTEMVAAKMEDWFGLPGVAWMFGALFLAFIVAVYLGCRRQGGALPAMVATGMAVIASTPSLSARPQVVTLLLLAVTTSSWLRSASTGRVPWLLIPITWVWATAHGMWTAGLVLSLVCCVGILLDRSVDRRTAVRMFAVPALSLAAACLTPLGPRVLSGQVAVGARTQLISEWGATSFRELPAFVAGVMIALVVIRWARARQASWLHLLILLVGCGWVALVSRTVGCGAVVVAPLLAASLQDVLGDRSPWRRIRRGELVTMLAGAAACLTALALVAPHSADHPGKVPDAFTSRLSSLPAGSTVAVEDSAGAWIEWRFPRLNPMIDGMLDAYPVDYIAGFADFGAVKPGWTGYLHRSGARVAVTRRGSSLTAALQDQLHWQAVDKDGRYVYLVAPRSG